MHKDWRLVEGANKRCFLEVILGGMIIGVGLECSGLVELEEESPLTSLNTSVTNNIRNKQYISQSNICKNWF